MTEPLFIAEVADKCVGDVVNVAGSEGRHAVSVKRLRVGESVLLADGLGHGIRGEVIETGKDVFSVRVGNVLQAPQRPIRWTAVQGLAKGPRSDIAIEALTELGVDEIIAWQAFRSVVRWEKKADKGIAKWQSTVREASKQSRRLVIPEISYADAAQIAKRISEADCALILHEDSKTGLSEIELPKSGEILFVIGPEGGISPEEVEQFESAGGKLVGLGEQVLRTSTAGLVALSQLQILSQLGAA